MRSKRSGMSTVAGVSAILLAPSLALAGGGITTLVLEGDEIPGVGLVVRIDNIAVNNAGSWLVEVDTDNPDTTIDSAVIEDGVLSFREGDPILFPTGSSIGSFDSITLNASGQSGWNLFLDGLPAGEDSGLFVDGTAVTVEGGPANTFSVGSTYIGFFDTKFNDAGDILVTATVDDPLIPGTADRGLILFENVIMGTIQSSVAQEGDILPGQEDPIIEIGTGPHETAMNQHSNVLYTIEMDAAPELDTAVYLWDFFTMTNTLIAQEASSSPVAGRAWQTLTSIELDLNNNGDYVYSGLLDGDTSTNSLLVRNDSKFRQEGDPVPSDGRFTFQSFGTGPLEIADNGRVLWYGDWDDPDQTRDSALFLDDEALIVEGSTVLEGSVVDTIRGVEDGYHMSDSGRFIVVELVLEDGREGAFLIEIVNCDEDVTGDGEVNVLDLLEVLSLWGPCPGCPADVNGDRTVNVLDVLAVLAAWGSC